jgi:hypothetical protein
LFLSSNPIFYFKFFELEKVHFGSNQDWTKFDFFLNILISTRPYLLVPLVLYPAPPRDPLPPRPAPYCCRPRLPNKPSQCTTPPDPYRPTSFTTAYPNPSPPPPHFPPSLVLLRLDKPPTSRPSGTICPPTSVVAPPLARNLAEMRRYRFSPTPQ